MNYRLIGIMAMTRAGVIGKDGKLPWRIKEDMRHFKDTTTGHTVVMGRGTWESLGGKPLSNRRNIVLSRNDWTRAGGLKGAEVYKSVEDLLATGNLKGDIFIIGGAKTYKSFLPYMDQLMVSWILEDYPGDTIFDPQLIRDRFPEGGVITAHDEFNVQLFAARSKEEVDDGAPATLKMWARAGSRPKLWLEGDIPGGWAREGWQLVTYVKAEVPA